MNTRRAVVGLAIAAAIVLGLAGSCTPFNPLGAAGVGVVRIFWASEYQVGSAALDGTSQEIIYDGSPAVENITALTLDPVQRQVYWADQFNQALHRANLDGSGHVMLSDSTGVNFVHLALDTSNRKLLAVDGSELWRFDLDGTNPEAVTLDPAPAFIYDLEVDPVKKRLYWVADETQIYYAPLSADTTFYGTEVVNLGGIAINRISVDGTGNTVYWLRNDQLFQRSQIGGSMLPDLDVLTDNTGPTGFAVDPWDGRVYWSEHTPDPDYGLLVQRAAFGDTSAQQIVEDRSVNTYVVDIALYLGP